MFCRYDHHQKTFGENASTVSPGKKWTTKLSSAGLVYLHYGRDIISGILEKKEKGRYLYDVLDRFTQPFAYFLSIVCLF